MDEQLTKDLIETFFRFKRIKLPDLLKADGSKRDLSVIETVLLKKISDGPIDSFSDLEDNFHVSKSAVSQMLGALEEKGYVTRELDKTNRRKRLLGLTPRGRKTVDTIGREVDAYFSGIVQRFGEKDTRSLVALFNRFAEIAEENNGV
jgi:DNA-binding MarR family transcriptional regulator